MVDETDEPFRQSLADLSRQLASRVPIEPPPFDAEVADKLPPEPTEAAREPRRHRPWLAVLALFVGFGLAGVIHVLMGTLGTPAEPPQSPPRTMAAVVPAPPAPVPPPNADAIAPNRPVTVDPPPPVTPVVVGKPDVVVPPKGKLEGYEVMEIQSRLKAAGLNPGPLDGVVGGQTASAIKEYESAKGKPATGKPDRALLQQLRQEPPKPQPAKLQ